MRQDKRKLKKDAKKEIGDIRPIRAERDAQASTNIKSTYTTLLNWLSNQTKFINTYLTYLQPLSPHDFSKDLVESLWNEVAQIEAEIKDLSSMGINDDNSKIIIDTVRLELTGYTILPLIYRIRGIRKVLDKAVDSHLFDD